MINRLFKLLTAVLFLVSLSAYSQTAYSQTAYSQTANPQTSHLQPEYPQLKLSDAGNRSLIITQKVSTHNARLSYADSLEKKLVGKKNISALFLGIGGGVAVPLSPFNESSNVTFGVIGRLEFASTSIFPFVIGGEVHYFSFNGADEFKVTNLLTNFKTKILSVGLNIEYSLSKLFRSSFTMPFLTADVKTNMIKREYDDGRTLENLPREENKISVGAGFGLTLFIFDFYVKYNHMKDNSFVGVYAKTKFPVIKF